METPILFLVFNRPSLTKRVFDEIKKAKPKILYVAIDGPREGNQFDIENIKQVVEIVTDLDWECKLELLQREKNLGCGLAVSSAIDWFFDNVEEGIILEDDCIPAEDFFPFCQTLLETYRYDKNVMAINGSNPFLLSNTENSYLFTSYNLIWGWGTWKESWNKYNYDLSKVNSFKIFLLLLVKFRFDWISLRSWYKHLQLVRSKSLDTWDYQWIYACFINNGLVVTPTCNLITNIGNQDESTHGVINSFYIDVPFGKQKLFPIKHPKLVKNDVELENKIRSERFGNTFKSFLLAKIKKNKLWA